MKNIGYIIIAMFFPVVTLVSAFAEEYNPGVLDEAEHEEYLFPEIAPYLKVSTGYSYVHMNGYKEEYEYPHSSLSIGGEFRTFSFPHRFHLEFDGKNTTDYFGDINYAYEDIFMFRGINRTLYHNLDNITLIDLDPATSPLNPNPFMRSPAVDVRDSGDDYAIQVGISSAFLRLKASDYPLHVYMDGMFVNKEGSQQQRSLLGSGYFITPAFAGGILRTSQHREVDSLSSAITVGTNSHLGPVEIDFSHTEKRFSAGKDNVLYDMYDAAQVRNGGIYPHNLIPELKGSSNTIKIHSSHTGSLVASATFTVADKENLDSSAKADYLLGSGELTWIPTSDISVFVKYRFKDYDTETPDEVEFADVCAPSLNSANNYACLIKKSIGYTTKTASVTIRYRLIPKVVLRCEFSHENIHRKNEEEWFLPDSTIRNIASLSADIRVMNNLKLKLKYVYKNINDPAYNIEPEQADEGSMTVTWTPVAWLSTIASYAVSLERKDRLLFVSDENLEESPNGRKVNREKFFGALNFLLLKNLSATVGYLYMHNKRKEDLAYHDTTGALFFDPGIDNKDSVSSVTVDTNYSPVKNLNLNAGFAFTKSEGRFFVEDINLTTPIPVSSLSELNRSEAVYHVGGEYTFRSGISAGIGYKYSRFRDLVKNEYDDYHNGEAHQFVVSVSKRW